MKDSNKNIDLNLVKRAKKGDYQAFDLLVIKYQTRLISTAFKFVKDMQIAEDIVQESLIKSYKSLLLFYPKNCSLNLKDIKNQICFDQKFGTC